jgi:mutual gliding-motility protein MglA
MKHSSVLILTALCLLARPAQSSFVNYTSREINVKVVYYAPSDATAATENLKYIYVKTNPDAKGKIITLATESLTPKSKGKSKKVRKVKDSSAFFDFLPLSLGEIRGFKVRVHLYTVPVGDDFNASRLLLLKGVDGIVFIADAAPSKSAANLLRLAELKSNLQELGYDFAKSPVVFQFVGTDSPGATPLADLKISLGIGDERPIFEAIPNKGVGVFDTLKAISKLVLSELKKEESSSPKKSEKSNTSAPR